MTNRRLAALLAGILLLMAVLPALAEEAETVTFSKLTVPADAEYVDLGKITVTSTEAYKKFYEFLGKLPNLKRVDMYATRIPRRRIDELVEKFPEVEFGWTMAVGNHDVRTDAVAFTTAHSDRSGRHKSEDFEVLKYCKGLLALDLGHHAGGVADEPGVSGAVLQRYPGRVRADRACQPEGPEPRLQPDRGYFPAGIDDLAGAPVDPAVLQPQPEQHAGSVSREKAGGGAAGHKDRLHREVLRRELLAGAYPL